MDDQKEPAIQPQDITSINKKFDILMQNMADYAPKIPTLLVEKILEEVGFESTDDDTFKMIGMLADKFLDDLLNQIHQSRYVQVENRSKKDKKNTKEDHSKFLTFDLIHQLKQSGINISESYVQPQHSVFKKE